MDLPRIEEVHSSLNKLALQNLNLLEELLKERQKFELALREGFFEMARARHSMGSKSVGALQLPTEEGKDMIALVKVDRDATNDGLSENVNFYVASKEADVDEEADGVRKRGKKGGSVEEITNGIKKFDVKDDPLKWFGVLVPQYLRNSQQIFHRSTYSVCKMASLQCNLESVRLQYEKLNKELTELTKA